METVADKKIQFKVWLEAARPQTLPAAFVPVWLGSALAIHDHTFNMNASGAALICALLIQIGTNFANDYFDHKSGADNDNRIGFVRATSAGLIPPNKMLKATILTMSAAFIMGLYLVWMAGWPILVVGVLSLLFGIAYTGGPFPLAYNGLGDLFVFIFFGIVAVMGTYYVNAFSWSYSSFWASLAAGALSTNILVVNNLRDIEQDRLAGKRTLGVLFGERTLKIEYTLMMLLAFAVPLHFFARLGYHYSVLLPLLTLPFAAYLIYQVWSVDDKRNLNQLLIQTARFMFLFGFIFGLALLFT